MKPLHVLLIGLILVVRCAAQGSAAEDLQRRADVASGGDCARISMQAARATLEDGGRRFAAGEMARAHQDVDTAVRYAKRSVDCSLQSRKAEKGTEIDLRKLIRKMRDVLQALDSEDRPHVSQSLSELEKQRDRMLQALFGTAAGGGQEKKR